MNPPQALVAPPNAASLARTFCALVAGLLALSAAPARCAAPKNADGMIVQVPATVTTESTNRLRSLLLGPIKRFEAGPSKQGGRFVVVCDFNSDGKPAGCDDFGASYTLAKYLRSLQGEVKGVSTVAYIHGDVTRHSVLPALACTEIVFSPDGKLGHVAPPNAPLGKVEQAAYDEITRGRFPPAMVRKMYDPAAVVEGFDPGETALYPFDRARKGLCDPAPSPTLEDVRVSYGLPRAGISRAIDRTVCWRIPVEGEVSGEVVELTQRRIRRALRAGANLLVLDLRCAGGSPDQAYRLGLYLARLNDERPDHPVETIAFVTNQSRNLALFPALGCSRIVMQKEAGDPKGRDEDDVVPREARLGGFGHYLDRHPELEAIRARIKRLPPGDGRLPALEMKLDQRRADLQKELRDNLSDLASRQSYPAAIVEGMVNRDVRVLAVERVTGASGRVFVTDAEYRADQQGPKRYRQVMVVKPWKDQAKEENQYLTLTADQARELGLIQNVVKDFNELCGVEGVVPGEVHATETDWLDGLADFLRNPWTSVILVMVGITCLILELKTPGVGLPGVLAAICFVLFFWAHSQLHGQIAWLAILLFILGLALIALEVFVLPGFGVCGISGVLLLLCSLGLVAYGHWPRSTEDWVGFGQALSPFGISMLGSLGCVFLIVKYLPHIPILNRLISKTPEEAEEVPEVPLHAENQALLGAIGVAATPLRPAGKTQFGDAYVDVVADGGFIMPGTRVKVIEVEGNRVVVKEV